MKEVRWKVWVQGYLLDDIILQDSVKVLRRGVVDALDLMRKLEPFHSFVV